MSWAGIPAGAAPAPVEELLVVLEQQPLHEHALADGALAAAVAAVAGPGAQVQELHQGHRVRRRHLCRCYATDGCRTRTREGSTVES